MIDFPPKLRNWVETAWVERIASHDSPGCHGAAFDNAIFIDRLVPIMRAGRIKTTGAGRQSS